VQPDFVLIGEILEHRIVKNTNLETPSIKVPGRHALSKERSLGHRQPSACRCATGTRPGPACALWILSNTTRKTLLPQPKPWTRAEEGRPASQTA